MNETWVGVKRFLDRLKWNIFFFVIWIRLGFQNILIIEIYLIGYNGKIVSGLFMFDVKTYVISWLFSHDLVNYSPFTNPKLLQEFWVQMSQGHNVSNDGFIQVLAGTCGFTRLEII